MKFVVIRDMADGNETVGTMWQETCIFDESASLKEVMEWAEGKSPYGASRKHIQITRPAGETHDPEEMPF